MNVVTSPVGGTGFGLPVTPFIRHDFKRAVEVTDVLRRGDTTALTSERAVAALGAVAEVVPNTRVTRAVIKDAVGGRSIRVRIHHGRRHADFVIAKRYESTVAHLLRQAFGDRLTVATSIDSPLPSVTNQAAH